MQASLSLLVAALLLVPLGLARAAPMLPTGSAGHLTGSGTIAAPGDTQEWSFGISRDNGTYDIFGVPSAGLQMTMTLREPAGFITASATSAVPGSPATLLDLTGYGTGLYLLTVGGANGTAGSYTFDIVVTGDTVLYVPSAVPAPAGGAALLAGLGVLGLGRGRKARVVLS